MTKFKHYALGTSILAGLTFAVLATPAMADTILTGSIKSSTNQALEGIPVSARMPGQTFTTTVYTDAAGEYYFPALPSGKYRMWAQGVGFQDGVADLELKGNVTKKDFQLGVRQDFWAQMHGDEVFAAMPEATDEDKKMKVVFRMACMGCHGQAHTLKAKFDARGWENIITLMSRITSAGYRINYGDMADDQPNHLMVHFKEPLAAWLGKIRGPNAATVMKPYARPRPKGEETMVVIREYDTNQPGTGLPLWMDGSLWSEGTPSKLNIKNHHSIDGTLDDEGNVYFSDDVNSNPFRTIGRIDWKTGKTTNIKVLRRDGSGLAANNHDVITDKDGMVWFGTEGKMYRYNPKTEKLDSYLPPRGARVGSMLAEDPLGGIWSPQARFDSKDGSVKSFPLAVEKSAEAKTSSYGVAADAVGDGWVTMQGLSLLSHMDWKTGKVEAVKLPVYQNAAYALFTGDDRKVFEMGGGADFGGHGKPDSYSVRKPSAGPGPSDSVWGPSWFTDSLVRVNIDTHEIKTYQSPYHGGDPYQTVVDKDGMVWVIFTDADFLARFNPKTEQWSRVDMPTIGADAHGLQVHTVHGKTMITVPYWDAGKAAQVQFRTQDELTALKAAAKKG